MYEFILALILSIAVEYGLPPYFVLSVALIENPTLNPEEVSETNNNGSVDRGVMQLSSSWYDGDWSCPETNIRAACEYIRESITKPGVNTWYAVAIVYNAGYGRLYNPPESTINYAARVMTLWHKLEGLSYINPVIKGR
jgi:soluble lytic murein transglycosylase-like protein